jgi:hypothetical protein
MRGSVACLTVLAILSPAAGRGAQRNPSRHLWAVRKDGQQVDCELRDHGPWGVEVQIYRERECLYGRRWPTRALAIEEANDLKAACLRKGGVLIA